MQKIIGLIKNQWQPILSDWTIINALAIASIIFIDTLNGGADLFKELTVYIGYSIGFLIISETRQLYWLFFVEFLWYLASTQSKLDAPLSLGIIMASVYMLWSWHRLVFVTHHFEHKLKDAASLIYSPKFNQSHPPTRRSSYQLHELVNSANRLDFEQKLMNESNLELVEFLSHDLRAPQVSILCTLEIFKKPASNMSIEELLQDVGESVVSTLRMTDSALEFGQANSSHIQMEELSLLHVLQLALEKVKPQARAKNITIYFLKNLDDEPWIMGDGHLLERAIINVMTNAIRYSRENTSIKVIVNSSVFKENSNWVDLIVKDNGVGMDDMTVNALLTGKKLQRQNSIQPDAAGSRGMGVRITRSIIQRHCGTIHIDSTEGEGTEFKMSLPLN